MVTYDRERQPGDRHRRWRHAAAAAVREYSVIATSADTLQLGATFDAQGANTGDLFAPAAGVDAERDRIRFSVPHRFETGEAVKYDAAGDPISTGLNETGTFFVRRLDDPTGKPDAFALKLYASRDEAIGAGGFADRVSRRIRRRCGHGRITIAGQRFTDRPRRHLSRRRLRPRSSSTGVDVEVARAIP